MKIAPQIYNFINVRKNFNDNKAICSNLLPLKCDTFCFSSKKTQNNYDLFEKAVIEKYDDKTERIKSRKDLNDWIEHSIEVMPFRLYDEDSTEEIKPQKKKYDEWYKYISKDKNNYSPALKFLILDSITTTLENNRNAISPIFNEIVVKETVSDYAQMLQDNKKCKLDFDKLYVKKLLAYYLTGDSNSEVGTQWIVVPSKKNDSNNFEKNIELLKTLAYDDCGSIANYAMLNLQDGDVHYYIENGYPKIGIRFVGKEISEIRGENNKTNPHTSVHFDYIDIVNNYIQSHNYNVARSEKEQLSESLNLKIETDKIKSDLKEAIKNKDSESIFNYFGINTKYDTDGKFIISEYKQPSKKYTFKEIGIDENELLKNVVKIEGNADFTNSVANIFPNLEIIEGDVVFKNVIINDLSKLKTIKGNVTLEKCKIDNISNLKTIDGNATIKDSRINHISSLENVNGCFTIDFSKIQDMGGLKNVDKNFHISSSFIKDISNLKTVGGSIMLLSVKNIGLDNLKTVGENLQILFSTVKNIDSLEAIGKSCILNKPKIKTFNNLKSIIGTLIICDKVGISFPKLEEIGCYAHITGPARTKFPNLKKVGNGIELTDTPLTVQDFKNVQTVEILG